MNPKNSDPDTPGVASTNPPSQPDLGSNSTSPPTPFPTTPPHNPAYSQPTPWSPTPSPQNQATAPTVFPQTPPSSYDLPGTEPIPNPVPSPLSPQPFGMTPPSSPWPQTPPTDNPMPGNTIPPTAEFVPAVPSGNITPLDNPWSVPTQPPQINGGFGSPPFPQPSEPNSSFAPSTPPFPSVADSQPPASPLGSEAATPQVLSQDTSTPVSPPDAAPTDLSHLIGNTPSEPASVPQPETLISPTNNNQEVPTVATSGNGHGIPKWVIGLGIGLLLAVAGASAYFIIGVGQPQNGSVPATKSDNSQKSSQVKPPLPIATPISQPTPEATSSSGFGDLEGSSTSPTPQASSAADLLRQRQGR